ncbi:MAG: PDDEXK nuclease domain-containing protein [Patescibacteria group bacterium]|nr:PDDEXK nuclease domain-containing protein [Patescibacteria group bacterium]
MNEIKKYEDCFAFVSEKIYKAQIRTHLKVNNELLKLYWEIGNTVLDVQNRLGWGSKFIDRLSKDIKQKYPDISGFSIRNLKYMRAFADAYPDFPFVQVPLAQNENKENKFVQVSLAQITWYHHISLLTKVKLQKERAFYIAATAENKWSRDIMLRQIESNLYKRSGKALNNFTNTLPDTESDLAQSIFKDPYKFDFLGLHEKFQEKEIEKQLTEKITDFLLELGRGFAFVGKQFPVEIEGEDYKFDLLFYHTLLHAYIVVELKAGDFKPEYISKLNFYISAVDDKLAGKNDNQSIGLLLCASKNNVKVEYAMRGFDKPIGIAAYELEEFIKKSVPEFKD